MKNLNQCILGLLAVVIFGTLFVLCSHRAAHAEGAPGNPFADWRPCKDWSVQDTLMLASGTALIAVDWAQTRKIAVSKPKTVTVCDNISCTETTSGGFHETNSVLGAHPRPEKVNQYFTLIALSHFGVSCILPSSHRGLLQSFVLGLEVNQVWVNHSVGVRITGSF